MNFEGLTDIIRFYGGLGKPLSTWELEKLADEEAITAYRKGEKMPEPRAVSLYRELDQVVITTKSGKIKFFKPTPASTRRMMKVLRSLDTEDRADIGFAQIYGGGFRAWVDPKWTIRRRGG